MPLFPSRFDQATLKSSLKLSIQRFQLLQKKKKEINSKIRKEIAEYIASEKIERARIKAEQLIREDYLLEAYEILENYCDAILSRIGLIIAQSSVDESMSEVITTLIWVSPRLSNEIPELNSISNQLLLKYGKRFHEGAQSNCLRLASSKVVSCLGLQPPSMVLVDKYLKAIADVYRLKFEPTYVETVETVKQIENQLIDDYEREKRNKADDVQLVNVLDLSNPDVSFKNDLSFNQNPEVGAKVNSQASAQSNKYNDLEQDFNRYPYKLTDESACGDTEKPPTYVHSIDPIRAVSQDSFSDLIDFNSIQSAHAQLHPTQQNDMFSGYDNAPVQHLQPSNISPSVAPDRSNPPPNTTNGQQRTLKGIEILHDNVAELEKRLSNLRYM